jgi:glycosyltransferase involved in cell wall biosynthesis
MTTADPPSVSCIIPAYNEASRIGAVLDAVAGHPALDEVIVVDDGSRDGTAEAAARDGVQVIACRPNGGKTRALLRGLEAARGNHIMLIDADLQNLTADHVHRLAAPVLEGRARLSISLRGNAPAFWRRIGIDYISGERVLGRSLLSEALGRLSSLPPFGFEVFLNEICIRDRTPIAVVRWDEVASPYKHAKRGLVRGVAADIRMLGDIARTVPPHRLMRQIVAMRRLRIAEV